MIVLYITLSARLNFFPSIFLNPLLQTSALHHSIIILQETLKNVSPVLNLGLVRALIPLRLDIREPFNQDFIASNRQSGKLVAPEEQSVLAAHMSIIVLALPHHAEGHIGRSLSIPCYGFYISPNIANTILNICRELQKSAQ